MRIRPEEFERYAPHTVGDVVRINHDSDNCYGHSKSMIITRKGDDSISAHCFRCNASGYIAGRYSGFKGIQNYNSYKNKRAYVPKKAELPKDMTLDPRAYPPKVVEYLSNNYISPSTASTYSMGWSKFYESLIYPCYRDSELVGLQYRYFGTNPDTPRYRTSKDATLKLWRYYDGNFGDHAVIVEDMLSGIRCADYANTMVLYGTELHDCALSYLTSKIDRATIFLDDDNSNVQKKQSKMRDRLRMVGIKTSIYHSGGKDPKHYSPTELEQIIGGF